VTVSLSAASNCYRSTPLAERSTTKPGFASALAGAIVLAAILFNFGLCFLSTRGYAIGAGSVIACEVLILSAALLLGLPELTVTLLLSGVAVVTWLLILYLLNPDMEIKIFRDLAIPFGFYALGKSRGNPASADRLVYIIVAISLLVGIWEMIDETGYENFFDIIDYYINKGGASESQANDSGTLLFVSGIRPDEQGRSILPILGGHRVSSVMLEPVSAGNLGAIAVLWFIARGASRSVLSVVACIASAAIVVVADSRLGLGICAVGLLAYFLPPLRSTIVLIVAPFLAVAFLLALAALAGDSTIDNGLLGRLLSSGSLMLSWGPDQWFGLKPSPAYPWDSGYGYVFSNMGLLPSAALWGALICSQSRDGQTDGFTASLALYFTLSLAVSGSVFTIKTAALLWFLRGALDARHSAAIPYATVSA